MHKGRRPLSRLSLSSAIAKFSYRDALIYYYTAVRLSLMRQTSFLKPQLLCSPHRKRRVHFQVNRPAGGENLHNTPPLCIRVCCSAIPDGIARDVREIQYHSEIVPNTLQRL